MDTNESASRARRCQVIHFRDIQPWKLHKPDPDIPEEIYQAILPPIYLLMGPRGLQGAERAIVTDKNLTFGIVECLPGRKAPLHMHTASTELFICLKGRIKVRSVDEGGDSETILDVFDMMSAPPGAYRDFVNVTDEPALLLAVSVGDANVYEEDIIIHPEESRQIAARYGEAALKKIEAATGYRLPLDEGA
jgi:mannose-6-phosphate isomerase-like protein (cupin superfamily)